MANKEFNIYFNYHWKSEQTDCRKCSVCEDMIFSDMWRMIIITSHEPEVAVIQEEGCCIEKYLCSLDKKVHKTDTVICSSCHEIIQDGS